MSLLKKLKLYDGQSVDGFTPKDVKELQDESVREGMDGSLAPLRHQPALRGHRAGRRHLRQFDRRPALDA